MSDHEVTIEADGGTVSARILLTAALAAWLAAAALRDWWRDIARRRVGKPS